MKRRQLSRKYGFTLIELLVVVVIIVMIMAMSMPAMSSFMRQRRLKAAAVLIQGVCMEARARAIAERERQYVVFFVSTNSLTIPTADLASGSTNPTKVAAVGSIDTFDSNESGLKDIPLVGHEMLPEYVRWERPTSNFYMVFYPDGTMTRSNIDTNTSGFKDPEDVNYADATTYQAIDLILAQPGTNVKCFIETTVNSGRVLSAVK